MDSILSPIGFLGDTQSIQYQNFIEMCKGLKYRLFPFEEAFANKNQILAHSGLSRKLGMLKSFTQGRISKKYRQDLDEYLYRSNVRCLVSYWGTNTFEDIISIKKCHPEIKIVLNILCHPMGLHGIKIFFQNLLMCFESRYIDGIIFNSKIMKMYFDAKGLNKKTPSLVFPPLLSKYYFPQTHLNSTDNFPNLLFMGRMDWWNGQPTDNISSQINALLDIGIHVYHSDKTGKLGSHPLRHYFYPMNLKELTQFATQFDASLNIYNLDVCKKNDRFRLTIPDRLITSVTAGIPVALPKHGYDACKEFLNEYKAFIEFNSFKELRDVLSRRDYIQQLREIAQKNSSNYAFENDQDRFSKFLAKFL